MKIPLLDKDRIFKVLQSEWYKIICNIQSDIIIATHQFFTSKGMKTCMLPLFTNSISSPMGKGSDSLPMEITLFNKKTYLSDSMQFLLEYLTRMYHVGVYYMMPSFRGEDVDSRHLIQFYHVEVEFIANLERIMRLAEEYVKYITLFLFSKDYLQSYLQGRDDHIKKFLSLKKIESISFYDAFALLSKEKEGYVNSNDNGIVTITPAGEMRLIELFGPVWVTNFPHLSVPFYQEFSPDDENIALASDLLLGIGEVIGCGQRHQYYKDLKKSLHVHKINEEAYDWYCSMKKLLPLVTSGFGMGVERYMLWLLMHSDIRDIPIFYRDKSLNHYP